MHKAKRILDKRLLYIVVISVALITALISFSPGYAQASGYTNLKVFDTPGTYSWTVPPNVTSIMVEVWGGGGYGGVAGAPGGGGGGYSTGLYDVTPGTTYTVTVGKGGKYGGSAENYIGGNSSFGSIISATGGKSGGSLYTGTLECGTPPCSEGGIGSGGHLNLRGGRGSGSCGGNAPRGGSGGCGIYGVPGSYEGEAPGGGGSGNVGYTAGEGANGTVIVYWSVGGGNVTGNVTGGEENRTPESQLCAKTTERIGVTTTTETATDVIHIFNTTTRCASASCADAFRGTTCKDGTGGSKVCMEYTGSSTMKATVTWTASGGGGSVNYAGFKDSSGKWVKWSSNVCYSGAASFSADLPISDTYTYEIYSAWCVRPDACSGCGSDVKIMSGGPFGCPNCVGDGCVCTSTDVLPVSQCTYKVMLKEFATDDVGAIILKNYKREDVIADDSLSCPYVCTDTGSKGKTAPCRTAESLNADITGSIIYDGSNFIDLSVADKGDYSRGINAVFEIRNRKINLEAQYCVAGNVMSFCAGTDTSCGSRTCENCNAKDGWRDTGKNVLMCANNTLTTFKEQEFRNYGCGGTACDYVIDDRQLVVVSEGGSCSINASISISPGVVKLNSTVSVSSVAVAKGNVTLECAAGDTLLCRSNSVSSNPSCSFKSPWTDTGNKTFFCSIEEDIGILEENATAALFTPSITSDNLAPFVAVEGAPESFEESALANVSCTDNIACKPGSSRLLISSEPMDCPQDYEQYDIAAPKNISKHSFVCAAALDVAGNAGFSDPAEFRVLGKDLPVTTIVSPPNGTVKGADFPVGMNDTGAILACEYRIISNGTAGAWSTRDCNSDVIMTVGANGSCASGSCRIEARTIDIIGREGHEGKAEYIIDTAKPEVSFYSPAAGSWQVKNFTVSVRDNFKYGINRCEYRVLSKGIETAYANRTCNSDIIISVGPGMDCRDDGGNACMIEARAISETGTTGIASRSFSIDLSGNKYDFTSFGSVRYEKTDVGVNFSGSILSVITFPTFITCNGKYRIDDCRNSYSVTGQNCGLDKPCFCGSLSSMSCNFKCNDMNSTFYLLVKGFSAFEEKVVVSTGKDFECPSFRLDEINNITMDFMELSKRGEMIRQQLTYLIDHSEGEKKLEYENIKKRVEIGLSMIREYLQYVNETMKSLSVTKANEIIQRSAEVKKKILDLIFTPVVSLMSIIDKKMSGEAILGSNASVVITVENKGKGSYANVECEFGDGTVVKTSSKCLFVAANTTRSFTVPIVTGKEATSNVSCSVYTSVNSDCSSGAIADFTRLGSLQIRRPVLSFVAVNAPSDAVAGDIVILQADVNNSGIKEQSAYVNCTFVDPRGDMFYAVADSQSIQSKEVKTFFVKQEVRTAGRWLVRSCSVYNDAAIPFVEAEKNISAAFNVTQQQAVAECSVNIHCPGTDNRCYCGSASCQPCSLGTRCVSYQCISVECVTDAECTAGNACQDNRCVNATIELEALPPPVEPVPLLWLIIIVIAMAVPAGLYIYFKRVARTEEY